MTDSNLIPDVEDEGLNQTQWAKFRDTFYETRGHLTPFEQDVYHHRLSDWQRSVLNQFKLTFERVPDEFTEEERLLKHLKEI